MKNTLFIAIVAGLLVGGGVYLYDTWQMAQPAGVSVAFNVLAEGMDGGYPDKKNYIIKDQAELNQLWRDVYADSEKQTNPPQVDFDKNVVIAVFGGSENTGGRAIEIKSIRDEENARLVQILSISPKKGCVLTRTSSAPYFIVSAPQTDLDYTKSEKEVLKCI